jgi:hypothetical protein
MGRTAVDIRLVIGTIAATRVAQDYLRYPAISWLRLCLSNDVALTPIFQARGLRAEQLSRALTCYRHVYCV